MQPNEQSKPKKNTARPLGRLGAFLLVTLALLLITLLGVIWVLEKGPSPTITEKFCRSMRETSAIRWIPNIFLSQEEVDAFKSESTENDETETVNTSLIRIAPAAESGTETADDGVELIAITRGTAKGKLLIVRDPRASFSAFRVRNSTRRPPACSSRSLWPSMAALPERTRAASTTKTAAATAACRRGS